MTSFDGNNQISCHEAQLFMSPYMEDDPSLTQAQREAFEAHLMVCSACREEYEEDKQLIVLVKKYWGPISEGTRNLLEKGGYPEQEEAPRHRTRPMTVKESWEDLKRRSPSLTKACRRQEEKGKRRRLFWRIGKVAAAASILVAVSIVWIVLQNCGDGQPADSAIVATQTQDRIPANAFAELSVSIASVGCGCSKAKLTSQVLKPGESATVTVEVDTTTERGRLLVPVSVRSNDPQRALTVALVGAKVTLKRITSCETLYLGRIRKGERFSKSFFVHDVGILAFVLAGWSFWDFVQYKRTGDIKKVTLGLPKSIRQRIHKVIRKGLTTRGLVVGSITVGFLVAVLESLCTGQVYLPTIVFLTRAPGLRGSAIAYLLLYNLMFILPLVGILIIGYLGVKSEYMGNFLRHRLAAVKLAMAILFAGLGVLVIATV